LSFYQGVGDAARSIGTNTVGALSAAKRYDDEHHVSKKTYEAAKSGISSTSKFCEEHKVIERTSAAASATASATGSAIRNVAAFNEKHKVTEKAGGMMTSGWNVVRTAMSSKTNTSSLPPGSQP